MVNESEGIVEKLEILEEVKLSNETLKKEIEESNENLRDFFDVKIIKCNKKINNLTTKVEAVKECIIKSDRNRSIEWALNELEKESPIGCFEYYWEDNNPELSTDAVRDLLLAFRRGGSNYFELGNNLRFPRRVFMLKNKEKQRKLTKEFQEKVSYQIELLLGREPQIEWNEDESFNFYYS